VTPAERLPLYSIETFKEQSASLREKDSIDRDAFFAWIGRSIFKDWSELEFLDFFDSVLYRGIRLGPEDRILAEEVFIAYDRDIFDPGKGTARGSLSREQFRKLVENLDGQQVNASSITTTLASTSLMPRQDLQVCHFFLWLENTFGCPGEGIKEHDLFRERMAFALSSSQEKEKLIQSRASLLENRKLTATTLSPFRKSLVHVLFEAIDVKRQGKIHCNHMVFLLQAIEPNMRRDAIEDSIGMKWMGHGAPMKLVSRDIFYAWLERYGMQDTNAKFSEKIEYFHRSLVVGGDLIPIRQEMANVAFYACDEHRTGFVEVHRLKAFIAETVPEITEKTLANAFATSCPGGKRKMQRGDFYKWASAAFSGFGAAAFKDALRRICECARRDKTLSL